MRALVAVMSAIAASCATALFAHLAISASHAIGLDGDAFAHHSHAALGPVFVVALGSLAIVGIRAAVAATSDSADRVLAFADTIARTPAIVAFVVILGGAILTLGAMEAIEETLAMGHVTSLGDLYGGNVASGLSIVAAIAASIASFGLRLARALVRVVASARAAFVVWIAFARGAGASSSFARRGRALAELRFSQRLAHRNGRRAPPFITA